MKRFYSYGCVLALGLAGATAGGASDADALPQLPSGLSPALMEEFIEVKPDGMFTYARFRFLEPAISGANAPGYEVLSEDFLVLCEGYALPRISGADVPVDRIVISYSDRAVEFGATDPDATQFFEQFTVKNGNCLWEQF